MRGTSATAFIGPNVRVEAHSFLLTTMQSATSSSSALILLRKTTKDGVVTAPSLDRPVSSLAVAVQDTMGAFYNVHKGLLSQKGTPKTFMEQFKRGKHVFRMDCETMREVLQTSYRHASDYATSSQRAPNDRSVSAKRCFLSAKGVQRDVQQLLIAYEKTLADFETQREALAGYFHPKPKIDIRSSLPPPREDDYEDPIVVLYDGLSSVRSSLKDILAFWESHVTYLSLLVNRQSNFPSPGDETKATFDLWTKYQALLVQTSNSISSSADALSIEPVTMPLTRTKTRRSTYPQSRQEAVRSSTSPPLDSTIEICQDAKAEKGWKAWFKRLFRSKA